MKDISARRAVTAAIFVCCALAPAAVFATGCTVQTSSDNRPAVNNLSRPAPTNNSAAQNETEGTAPQPDNAGGRADAHSSEGNGNSLASSFADRIPASNSQETFDIVCNYGKAVESSYSKDGKAISKDDSDAILDNVEQFIEDNKTGLLVSSAERNDTGIAITCTDGFTFVYMPNIANYDG